MAYQALCVSPKAWDEAATNSDGETDCGSNHTLLGGKRPRSSRPPKRLPLLPGKLGLTELSVLLNLVLLITCSVLLGTRFYEQHLVLNPELRRCSTYSPIHNLVDLGMHDYTVNGTFFPSKNPSIARELPNPDADAIWDDWEIATPIPITRAQIIKMGKDPSTVAKMEDEHFGMGDDAYVGSFDVLHLIHCLNGLRHMVYGDYYNKTFVDHTRPSIMSWHMNHCIDLLLQNLQCSGNVNLITWHWVRDQPWPFPDMSVNRKCINFDRLMEWKAAVGPDMERYDRIMAHKPKGVKERPAPDALYTYHNVTSPNHVGGANPGNDFNF